MLEIDGGYIVVLEKKLGRFAVPEVRMQMCVVGIRIGNAENSCSGEFPLLYLLFAFVFAFASDSDSASMPCLRGPGDETSELLERFDGSG
jgi:hypothetical protein